MGEFKEFTGGDVNQIPKLLTSAIQQNPLYKTYHSGRSDRNLTIHSSPTTYEANYREVNDAYKKLKAFYKENTGKKNFSAEETKKFVKMTTPYLKDLIDARRYQLGGASSIGKTLEMVTPDGRPRFPESEGTFSLTFDDIDDHINAWKTLG